MVEAVHTLAPTAAIWVIVVVMSILVAFMVTAPLVADITQARASRRRRLLMTLAGREPVVGADREDDAGVAAGTAGPEALAETRTPGTAEAGASGEPAPAAGAVPAQRAGDAPTLADLPAQTDEPSGSAAPGRHAMPAQRGGESDHAERSVAAPATDDRDEPDADRP